ncbi:MAG: homoserine dehydrogenase [Candidatus Latescibacteria bacterium]|nr:homoserine dehydrogenase [Candidatus Latescibacterota bacterium]
MEREVQVGLIGLGTIGRGVARLLLERSAELSHGRGFDLELVRIADLDITTPRGIELPREILTTDAYKIIDDTRISVVIELIGGIEPAKTYILRALEKGKSVVTANKALLSKHGKELLRAAEKNGVLLFFEASVCGGIPIIRILREGLAANRIEKLYGILNGTTNYILTRMAQDGSSFQGALRQAQQRGYAEPDPTLDISGQDAAQKLSILLRVGFNASIRVEDIFCEGIEKIAPQDITYARELGYTIKLLAIAKRLETGIEARVHPVLIPSGTLLADVRDEFNSVELTGDAVGTQIFYGKGAGEMPTASAVVADVIEIAEQNIQQSLPTVNQMLPADERLTLLPTEEVETPYYFRFTVIDKPGVLAEIARLLAVEGISIASVIQKERRQGGTVPIVMMTHRAKEKAMRLAIGNIDQLPVVKAPTQVIRVEEV